MISRISSTVLRIQVSSPNKLIKRWHGHHHHKILDHSSKEGTRVTLIGLMSNVSLTMVKGAGGVLYNSSSLMAEALHSLGDLFSDFITLWAYRTARSKKADKKYPYGFGKIEPLGGLTISSLLIGGSVGMAIHSFHQLQDILHGPMLSLTDSGIISPWAAVLLVASIGVKEWLYRITLKVGKKTQSSVLIANAYHHRSDVYSSVVALAGVAGASMGYGILDPIGGLVVSAMILKMGVDSAIPSFKELMDIAVPDLTLNEVHQVLGRIKIDKNIHGFHSVRGRKMGPFIHIDLQLQVNPNISVSHAHQLAENARHALLTQVEGVSEVIVHVDSERHNHAEEIISTHPTSEIEKEIIEWALEASRDDIEKISHSTFHYRKDKIEVVLDIVLKDDNILLKDAQETARKVLKRLRSHPKKQMIMNNELTLKYRKIFMGKKERPLYVPPSLRQEQSQAASSSIKGSTSPKPRLEVKLSKKEKITHAWEKEEPTKEKITHAWEKEEPSKEKIVHAWEKEEPSTFKLPSKPNKDKSNQSGKKGKIHYNLQRTSRKERQDSTESLKNLGNGSEIPEPSASSKDKSGTDVTFVSAKDYLAEMANSDWNDLDELDYSKVPQWNH